MEFARGIGDFRQMRRLIQTGVGRLASEFAPSGGIENRHAHLSRPEVIFNIAELMVSRALLLITYSIPYQNDPHVILCFGALIACAYCRREAGIEIES